MKLPEDSRAWIGGGIAATVLVLAAGWFGLVHPELSTVSSQHADADSASAANDVLQTQVTTLKTESRQLDSLVHGLAVARNELPIQADLPTYIRQLGLAARITQVGITSLSIGAVSVSTTAGTAAAAGTTGTTDSGTTDSGTADSGTAAAATPSPAATDSTTGTTAVAPVVAAGPAGELFQIQVSVTTSGDLTRQKAFLTAIQQPGTRAALISSAQLAPAAASGAAAGTAATPSPGADAAESATAAPASIDGVSDLTTIMTIFVAPQTPAAAAELTKQLTSRTAR